MLFSKKFQRQVDTVANKIQQSILTNRQSSTGPDPYNVLYILLNTSTQLYKFKRNVVGK